MKSKRKSLICTIAILLSSLIFSCGSQSNPDGGHNIVLWGYVYNSSSAPVEGIKVTSNYGYTHTDSEGYFEILCYYFADNKKIKLSFSDASGTYKEIIEKEFSISENLNIYLEAN